jgi:SAM-dependent methyltransferase
MNFSNEFGPLFPTENQQLMIEALKIKHTDFVLDVGGGGSPFQRADIIIDYDLHSGYHRDENIAPIDNRWIAADIHSLPFTDKTFDFVYCSHVLEHTEDPQKACEELMRVAHRGYIETPRKMTELIHGHPTHRWLVDTEENLITFEPRLFIDCPTRNFGLAHLLNYPSALDLFLTQYRNVSCVQLLWERTFKYRIHFSSNKDEQFNYNNTTQAAWSHFYFALNLLSNHAPAEYTQPHINRALHLIPELPIFKSLDAAALLISGKIEESALLLEQLSTLKNIDDSVNINLEAIKSKSINSISLPLSRGEYILPTPLLHKKRQNLITYISQITRETYRNITTKIIERI